MNSLLESAVSPVADAPVAGAPRQRILVVEDDTDLRKIYSKILTSSGYQVDTAEDGEAGWGVLAAHTAASYDLLITDNQMPNLTGVGLVQKLRLAHMDLPVIMASGTARADTEGLHLAAVLSKPFPLERLLETVDEILHWSTVMVNRRGDHLVADPDASVAVLEN